MRQPRFYPDFMKGYTMKRNMKKAVAIFLVLTAVLLLAACSKKVKSDNLGTWNAVKYVIDDVEVTKEDVGASTMVLNDDATVNVNFAGSEATGVWEDTEDGIRIDSEEDELLLVFEGEQLVLDIDGVKIYFTHDAPPAEE